MKTTLCMLALLVLLFTGCSERSSLPESGQPPDSYESESLPSEETSLENPAVDPPDSAEDSRQGYNGEADQGTAQISGETDTGIHNMGRANPMHLERVLDLHMPEETAQVEYYIDVKISEDGEYMWDDAQEVSLLVRRGDTVYPLISKLFTRGLLDCFVAVDFDTSSPTLVVTHKTPYSVEMYEYRYDEDNDVFWEQIVYVVVGDIFHR